MSIIAANNNIIGYPDPTKAGSIFDKVGLKSNDIVTEINEFPLETLHKPFATSTLRWRSTMEVMRRGQRQSLIYGYNSYEAAQLTE